MNNRYRWDPCVVHLRGKVASFANDYFGGADRQILLIAGAGFDPRTLVVPELLHTVAGNRVRLLLLREERRSPSPPLLERAEKHIESLQKIANPFQLVPIRVFHDDMAVVIGRSIVNAIRSVSFDGLTDVVVDWSALSIGGAFPLVRALLERFQRGFQHLNLHVMVVVSSRVDHAIERLPGGAPTFVQGYDAGLELDQNRDAARVWVPQLRRGIGPQLTSIHRYLESIERAPHDVMPVLPFPAQDPRLADRLLDEFYPELQSWGVSASDLAHAAEDDPLDLYRILVRLHDLRARVFHPNRPSQVILSPLGSKLLAIGAMMAALDRPMPVMYVEAPDFRANPDELDSMHYTRDDIVHLWLAGDVYPRIATNQS